MLALIFNMFRLFSGLAFSKVNDAKHLALVRAGRPEGPRHSTLLLPFSNKHGRHHINGHTSTNSQVRNESFKLYQINIALARRGFGQNAFALARAT